MDNNYNITNNIIIKLSNLTSLGLCCNNNITNQAVSKLIYLTYINLSYNRIITIGEISRLTIFGYFASEITADDLNKYKLPCEAK